MTRYIQISPGQYVSYDYANPTVKKLADQGTYQIIDKADGSSSSSASSSAPAAPAALGKYDVNYDGVRGVVSFNPSAVENVKAQLRSGQIDMNGAISALKQAATSPTGNQNEVNAAFQSYLPTIQKALLSDIGAVTQNGRTGSYDSSFNFMPSATTINKSVTTGAGTSSTTQNVYNGTSLVDYLAANGKDSSFDMRNIIARNLGIQNYTGTADQNTKILNALKAQPSNSASTAPANPLAGGSVASPYAGTTGGTGGGQDTSGMYASLISGNPFLADYMKDPTIKARFDSLPADLQGVFLQSVSALGKAVSDGKTINPDIELTPEQNKQFLDQAHSELDPYYQEVLRTTGSDIDTSISRLMEDYRKGVSRETSAFPQKLQDQAQTEADAGTAFSSGRQDRERKIMLNEQNVLDDAFTTASRATNDKIQGYEKTAGSDAASRFLNLPGMENYSVNTDGISPSGSVRQLYSPLGGLMGTAAKDEATAVANRKSQLETAFRGNRVLNLSSL